MKKQSIIFLMYLFITALTITVSAQEFNQGASAMHAVAFINSSELLDAMPEKATASKHLSKLNDNYKAELQLMENEYNKKYSDFITYQNTMAENIKLRRMQELTELEEKMNHFMELAQKDIESQEQQMLAPLKLKLKDAIRAVGIEHNFMVIYDVSNTGIVFVNPDAVDATPLVKQKLRIK